MRVVAGEARGRPLLAPKGRSVRPTTDRVRESIFNALVSLDAVEGARVLDLFAGTGALGIEALSRGAAHCTFVERDPAARAIVVRNLDATGLADRAEVVAGDAERWLRTRQEGGPDDPCTPGAFDLALLDPPYDYDGWSALLTAIPTRLLVIESDREVAVPEGWRVVRHKRYGSTLVVIARAADPGADGGRAVGDGPGA